MNTLTAIFISATNLYSLPPGLLSSLCYVESGHRVSAIHHDDGNGDSLGVCQVKYSTARWLGFTGTERELMNPANNVYYAAKYLSYQLQRYGEVRRAVIAYNIGHADYRLTTTKYQARVFKQWVMQER